MNLLVGITYYYPHVSGLTLYAQRLSENLVKRGHRVTVLTSRHLPSLPCSELHNGVKIQRIPVGLRLSKGFLMPGYLPRAWKSLSNADLVLINLPIGLTESLLSILARFRRKATVAVYHCAIQLPPGPINRIAQTAVDLSSWIVLNLADRIVGYTNDYATNTPPLSRRSEKLKIIPPPVTVSRAVPTDIERFKQQHSPGGEKLLGFAARFATEKGVEVALKALSLLQEKVGPTRILFAGEYQNVVGEEAYWERVQPQLSAAGSSWKFLGNLSAEQMGVFYGACDVLILPSLNRTESFGLVQVESMLCGTPVVVSALPGVRVPVNKTGMGRIAPIGDAQALAEEILEVLQNRSLYLKPRESIEKHFSLNRTLDEYEHLFQELVDGPTANLQREG